MKNKILAIAMAIVFVFGAGYLGYALGLSQSKPQTNINSDMLQFLDSKLVRDFNANILGDIVDISEGSLTIEGQGASLKLAMPKEISIYKQPELSGKELSPLPPELIKPENLKIGDSVSISVLMESSGKVTAMNIMVLQKSALESPLPVSEE